MISREDVGDATPRYLTLGVLAGAYRGGRANLKAMRTHVLADGAEKSLCGQIDGDHLVDELGAKDVHAVATCPACARRDPRVR